MLYFVFLYFFVVAMFEYFLYSTACRIWCHFRSQIMCTAQLSYFFPDLPVTVAVHFYVFGICLVLCLVCLVYL